MGTSEGSAISLLHDPPAARSRASRRKLIDLGFAILPATHQPSRGLLLTLYGGPGYSGIAFLDDFSSVDPGLRDELDLGYFDLRGVASSGGLDCPISTNAFYAGGLRSSSTVEDATIAARANAFATACPVELGELGANLDELGFYTTAQAVEDIEGFRSLLGVSELTLYGLSYGTQLGQSFATAHPDRVRGLVIDGVVDLSIPDVQFAAELTRATNDVLRRVATACAGSVDCAADFGTGGALAAFDRLSARLAARPAVVDFGLPTGARTTRTFTRANLDTAATAAMDEPTGRAAFLRALAAADAGNLVPLLRVFYVYDGRDPETLQLYDDGTYSDAVYYEITCNDYGHPAGATPAERQAPWLAAGTALRAEPAMRVLSPFSGDLPCATWPTGATLPPLPPPFEPAVPVLMINADADTATPFIQGSRMFARLTASAAASAITVHGGHHVMLGTGEPCVDRVAAAFLLDPARAAVGEETTCNADLVDVYTPLTGATAADLPTALDMTSALATEIQVLPELKTGGPIACDRAGLLDVGGGTFGLTGCSFVRGLVFDGVGRMFGDAISFEVAVRGIHRGQLRYTFDGVIEHVVGTLDGQPVDQSR